MAENLSKLADELIPRLRKQLQLNSVAQATQAGGGGVTDHGALTGLADDDHPQYLTPTRGDVRYYTQSYIDTLGMHDPVTSPLGSLGGDFATQALDINLGHENEWSVLQKFDAGLETDLIQSVSELAITSPHIIITNDMYSSDWTGPSGPGARIDFASGDAWFKNFEADTLTVKSFISDVTLALAGSQIITKSKALLSRDFTAPSTFATLYVYDLPGQPDAQAFVSGDYLRLRYADRGTGLEIGDVWGTVTSYANLANDEQSWTFTRTHGTAGKVVSAGMVALDYGVSGDGVIEMTALGTDSPHIEITTWVIDPSVAGNHTLRAQLGDLGEITDSVIGSLYGYGLYTTNAYLRGDFVAAAGKVAANDAGLNINSYFGSVYPGAGSLYEITFTDTPLDPGNASAITTGQIWGQQHSVGGVGSLNLQNEAGGATGVSTSYINLISKDIDAGGFSHVRTSSGGQIQLTASDEVRVSGDIVFTEGGSYGAQTIRPQGDSQGSLGEATHYFANLYVRNLYADNQEIIGVITGASWSNPGNMTINPGPTTGATTLTIANSGAGSASLHVESNIIVGGTVDGVDVGAHAADLTIHRAINDSSTSTTSLWSASKISSEIGSITAHDPVSSPLGTLSGNFATQALEVNTARNWDWSGDHRITGAFTLGAGNDFPSVLNLAGGLANSSYSALQVSSTTLMEINKGGWPSVTIHGTAITMPGSLNVTGSVTAGGVITDDIAPDTQSFVTLAGDLTIGEGNSYPNIIYFGGASVGSKYSAFQAITTGLAINLGGWLRTDIHGTVGIDTLTGIGDDLTISPVGDTVLSPVGDLALFPAGSTLMDGIQKYFGYSGGGTFGGPGSYIDWPNGVGDFRSLSVDEMIIKLLTVHDTAVHVGAIMASRSGSRLTRAFTLPAVGNSGTVYVRNIPGASDQSGNAMRAFEPGNDFILSYAAWSGGSTYAAAVQEIKNDYAEREVGSGGGNEILQNFEGVTVPALPSGWKPTGKDNSLTTDTSVWATVLDSNKRLITDAPVGGDSNYHFHYSGTGFDRTNYEYTGLNFSSSLSAGRGMTVFSKYADASPADKYVRVRRYSGGDYHVAVHGYAAPDGGTTSSGFVDSITAWTGFKLQIVDDTGASRTTLKARFWQWGTTQPTTWQIDCYWDGASRPTSGTWGVWGYQTANSPVMYDYLKVVDVGTTEVAPSVTLDMTHNSATALVAMVTSDKDTLSTVPLFFTQIRTFSFSAGSEYQYSKLYRYSGAPNAGAQSYTWSNSTGDHLAVTMIALEGTTGTVSVSSQTYQSGNSWTDNETAGAAGIFELPVLNVFYSDADYSTSEAQNLASYANSSIYRHKVSKLPFGEKPSAIVYTSSFYRQGVTARFTVTSDVNTNAAQMGFAYGKFTSRSTPADLEEHEQAWLVQITRGAAAGSTVVMSPETSIVDVGVSGDSFWIANAIDPLAGGAYDQIVRRGVDPWDWTTKLRSGYLGGTDAMGDLGFYFKENSTLVELSDGRALFIDVDMEVSTGTGDAGVSITGEDGIAIALESATAYYDEAGYTFTREDETIGGLFAYVDSSWHLNMMKLASAAATGDESQLWIQSLSDNDRRSSIYLSAEGVASGKSAATISMQSVETAYRAAEISMYSFKAAGKASFTYAGIGVKSSPDAGMVAAVTTAGVASTALYGLTTAMDNLVIGKGANYPVILYMADSVANSKWSVFQATDDYNFEINVGGWRNIKIHKQVVLPDLPTSNPNVAGALWNNGGWCAVSAG